VLAVTADHQSPLVLLLVLISVVISALYMTRLVLRMFSGEPRNVKVYEHAHEPVPAMKWPIVLLGVLTLVAGFVVFDQVGRLMGFPGGFGQFVFSGEGEVFKVNALVMVSSIVLVLAGIAGGFYFWGGAAERARAVGEAAPQLYRLLRNKFYIDDLYQAAINRVVLVIAGAVAWYDRVVVNDTGVNGPADLTRYGGFLLKFHETGRMPNYALVMTLGIVVLAVVAFIVGT